MPLPRIGSVCLVAAVWLATSGMAVAQEDRAAVDKAFEAYRTAILASDGAAALDAVDATTVAYYQEMLSLALEADSATVARRPMLDQLMVLAMRVRVPVDSLRAMDGASAFVYGVDQGWIGRESVQRLDLGGVMVTGDRATASVRSGETAVSKLRFGFVREAGRWRFDLTSFLGAMSSMLAILAEEQGMTEAVLLSTLLEAAIEAPVPSDAWMPVGRP